MKRGRKFPRLLLVALGTAAAASSAAAYWRVQNLPSEPLVAGVPESPFFTWLEPAVVRVKVSDPIAAKIVAAAHAQEGDAYNATYKKLDYPGGDVPKGSGACTDVVIRALRAAGFDLQKLIHEDMAANFSRYPDPWKLGHTDKNIDHRRVPNHMAFFARHGLSLPLEVSRQTLPQWKPGDIVCWRLNDGRWHTGIVSDGVDGSGVPLVIHNALRCTEQDYLTMWKIVGHYRYPVTSGHCPPAGRL